MVEANIGYNRETRRDNVRAVKSSSKTYFYNGYVNTFICKVFKGQGCCKFKERRVKRLKKTSLILHKVNDVLLWNHLPINAYSLSKVDQVR